MATTWPVTLPQTPLIRGYEEKKRENRLITEVAAGEPKIRRLFTAVPRDLSCMFVMNTSQWQQLINFYETDLEDGCLRFNWELPNYPGIRQFRFMSAPSYTPISHNLYEVSLQLEVLP